MRDLKKSEISRRIKMQKRTINDIDDVSFLFKAYPQNIKLTTDTNKTLLGSCTKHCKSVSFSLKFGEFSCMATRLDYWFKNAGEQQYCHERRHKVEWDYRGDRHRIGSYDMGPLLPLMGDKRPRRAGIIFDQISDLYREKHR